MKQSRYVKQYKSLTASSRASWNCFSATRLLTCACTGTFFSSHRCDDEATTICTGTGDGGQMGAASVSAYREKGIWTT